MTDTTESAPATSPRGRSGRAARVAARAAGGQGASASAPAFLRREIPFYELLSEEGLDLVERKADQLLSEIGMEIRDDAEALQLFRDAGASVDGHTVRFDPGHVRALAATAPGDEQDQGRHEPFHVGSFSHPIRADGETESATHRGRARRPRQR